MWSSKIIFTYKQLKGKNFDEDLDEAWVVFDEDTKERGDFDNAIQKAEAKKIKVAYSNECFELWYLLHFNYFTAKWGRKEYYKKLPNLLKKLDESIKITNWEKQGKSLSGIYELLENFQAQAIRNAKIF